MAENLGKTVFGEFQPDGAIPAGREDIGTSQTEPTKAQRGAVEALRTWDAMAQGALSTEHRPGLAGGLACVHGVPVHSARARVALYGRSK
jgi:hypothetical protein